MSRARTIVVILLLGVACVLTYGLPRLDLPKPRVLPVASFPKQIGDWRMIRERRPDPDVQKALPTAVIVDREYADRTGRTISLLLLTASEMRDIHSPAVCLPGSGWQTRSDRLVVRGGTKMTARVMAIRDAAFHVWFWYPSVPYPEPKHPFVRALYRWRLKAPGTYRPDTIADLSSSLLVRVIMPAAEGNEKVMEDFVAAIEQPLNELIRAVPYGSAS